MDNTVSTDISLDLQYKTKAGQEVNLFTTKSKARSGFPVVGEYLDSETKQWVLSCWTIKGAPIGMTSARLVKREKWDFWKVDDRVIVVVSKKDNTFDFKLREETKVNFHYAGSHNGVPYVFCKGVNSWTVFPEREWEPGDLPIFKDCPSIVVPIPYSDSDIFYESISLAE